MPRPAAPCARPSASCTLAAICAKYIGPKRPRAAHPRDRTNPRKTRRVTTMSCGYITVCFRYTKYIHILMYLIRLCSRNACPNKCLFIRTSILVFHPEHRLSRAPVDPQRPRNPTTATPHSSRRYLRRKKGPRRQSQRARGIERFSPGDGY